MAAASQPTQTTHTGGQPGGSIDPVDVQYWQNRIKDFFANTQAFSAPSPAGARTWHYRMFDCFNPIDECLMAWCCPCVTFGKIHHRAHKHPQLEGYSPLNASCLGYAAARCFGVFWFPEMIQRTDLRAKYNLEGSMLEDLARACCCHCCDLIQMEKESQHREAETSKIVAEPYQTPAHDMQYFGK